MKERKTVDFSPATARIGMRQVPGRSWAGCEAPAKVRCACICEDDGDSSDRAGPEMEELRLMLEKQRGRRKVPVWNRRPPAGTGGPIHPTSCSQSPRAATKAPLSPARAAARGGLGERTTVSGP
jgi:hypothetical protein